MSFADRLREGMVVLKVDGLHHFVAQRICSGGDPPQLIVFNINWIHFGRPTALGCEIVPGGQKLGYLGDERSVSPGVKIFAADGIHCLLWGVDI